MKTKIFYILIFYFIIFIPSKIHGNTRSHCKELLVLAKQEWIKKNYTLSIDYYTKVNAIAIDNNWTDIQAGALSDLGLVYTDILDYEKAIECYFEAYKITIKENHKREEIAILNNISQLYMINNDLDKANEYLIRGYNTAKEELQDTTGKAGIFAMNLSIIANKMKNYEQAEKYADIAIMIYTDQHTDSINLSYANFVKIQSLYSYKEYDKALNLALTTLNEFPIQNSDFKIELLLVLSRIYKEKHQFQKSVEYASIALENKPKVPGRLELYEHLTALYRDAGMPTTALLYQDSAIMMKDSSVKLNDMSRVKKSQIQFDLINSEKELAEKTAKQKAERILFMVIILFIFVLAIIFIFILRVQSIRNKQRKIIAENKQVIAENNQKITILELEKEKSEKLIIQQQFKEQETLATLEKEQLNNEIETKNRILTANVLSQSNKYELIKEILQDLATIPNKYENPVLDSIIRKLKLQLNDSMEWNNFLVYFQQINPFLFSSLKEAHPILTANDIQLLSCIYLNLDTKKIAYLLNLSVPTYNKKKQRLANKMNLKVSELYDYLVGLTAKPDSL